MKPQGPSCAIRSERLGKQRIVEPESSVNVLVARPRAPVSEAAGGVGMQYAERVHQLDIFEQLAEGLTLTRCCAGRLRDVLGGHVPDVNI
eukprot:CAMPEP_0195568600 /NCGR_PEP_ID=MMETSP0814-20130614/2334_1 /TAXON_ID=97485 /ORGANISM="Prymnesium parvum, Strain Texoma1" /LENGTH=89 /DNA_ID=CAMNT_0040703907 /DNA_START=249 /DNA_END=518 /DNA_ORIENTATION=+